MRRRPPGPMWPAALAVLLVGGCVSSAGEPTAAGPTPGRAVEADPGHAARAAAANAEAGEEREAEEELHMRARAMASLAAYRATSCAAAIAKIESLLRRGRGRWQAHGLTEPLSDDLVTALSEAELWANQSRSLCAADPQKARFEDLQLLMDCIWRYPAGVSKEEFEKRLRILEN